MRWLADAFEEVRWLFIGIALLLAYGVGGFLAFGYGFVPALYNTVLVVTTVGFTPPHALGTLERLFTASVAVFGIVMFLGALALFSAALVEGRFAHANRRRRMDRVIRALNDHFIICAYGRVGRAVARELEAEGVPFVVVDRLEDLEPVMRADGVIHRLGDPTSEIVLRAVGIERARGLVSAVDSDADNVYITLTARSLNPSVFLVARASEAAAASRLYRAGADRVISPYVASGRHMAMLALRPRMVDYLDIAGESMRLEEMIVEKGSPLAGRTLDSAGIAATPLVVRRAGGDVVPHPPGDLVLQEGDLVLVLDEASSVRGSVRKTGRGSVPRGAPKRRAKAKN